MSFHAKGMMKHGKPGKSMNSVSFSVTVSGKTESAVLAELKKKHPGEEIVITKLEFD